MTNATDGNNATSAAAAASASKPGEQSATPDTASAAPGTAIAPPAPLFTPEPERPFRPHGFQPRAELLANSPRVLITPDAYKTMSLYVEIASKEVGWLGTATLLPSGDILIDETFLLEQEVTSTETELSVEGQNKLVMDLVSQGDAGIEQTNRLRFWGHSHVRMGTGASGTDESTMVRFGRDGIPWYVRGIFNKLGRAEFTLYFYDKGYRINDAPWAVYDPVEQKVILEGGRIFRRSRFWERQEELSAVTRVPPAPATVAPATSDTPAKPAPAPVKAAPAASSGGLLSWTNTRPEAPKPVEPDPLPAILVPSDELRASVLAEFKAKVHERTFFGGWFFGGDNGANGSQPGAGPLDPANPNAGARYHWVRDNEGKWSRVLDTSDAGKAPFGTAPERYSYDQARGPDDRQPLPRYSSRYGWDDKETWLDRLLERFSAWLNRKPKDD